MMNIRMMTITAEVASLDRLAIWLVRKSFSVEMSLRKRLIVLPTGQDSWKLNDRRSTCRNNWLRRSNSRSWLMRTMDNERTITPL
jgi:hypothetical protein